ncbi:MAG: MliC family protein [Betaproteobacteria bacterium]
MPARPPLFRLAAMAVPIALAFGAHLTAARAAEKASPEKPADCGKFPIRSLERLMCKSATLTALDREMNRVLGLAARGAGTAAASALAKDQAAWRSQRAGCATNKTQDACLRELYVSRIAAIRADSRAARSADGDGTSLGPFVFRCEGVPDLLAINYVNVAPDFAWVITGGKGYLMQQQRSGRGARYEGNGTLFWEAQGEARWRPTTASPETLCTRATSH